VFFGALPLFANPLNVFSDALFVMVSFNFLKRLFSFFSGKKKPSSKEKQLSLSEVEHFVHSFAEKQRKKLAPFVAGKFSEIKHLLKQLKSLLQQLESSDVESTNAKLEKIVETSKRHSLQQLSSVFEKLSPPNPADLEAVRQYCLDSESFLAKEIPSFGKNIAYTSIILKDSMKGIGSLVGELQNVFQELNREFSENKEVFIESAIVSETKKILGNNEKILSLEETMRILSSEISAVEKQLLERKEQFDLLQNSEEAKILSGLGEKKAFFSGKKKSLEQGIFEKSSSLEKPLRKLERLAEEDKTSLEKRELLFLQDFLRNPLLALKRDPKAESFKIVLQELKKQLDSEAIVLKEKENEKRLAVLQELLEFNFFEGFFWKANEIEVELNRIEKEIRHSEFSKNALEKEKELRETQALLEEKGSLLGNYKKELEKISESSSVIKNKTESMLSELAKEKICISDSKLGND